MAALKTTAWVVATPPCRATRCDGRPAGWPLSSPRLLRLQRAAPWLGVHDAASSAPPLAVFPRWSTHFSGLLVSSRGYHLASIAAELIRGIFRDVRPSGYFCFLRMISDGSGQVRAPAVPLHPSSQS
ncbi:unnamed protein product [Prorocentrum cordatum]|uniref:Uncharacterized protein n=1 Tax=Prorocentrum cordatum TaxID=2364126 RepID=A0ABN9T614_9DINO|nr:unnamed protein product [Polarella glacialis]